MLKRPFSNEFIDFVFSVDGFAVGSFYIAAFAMLILFGFATCVLTGGVWRAAARWVCQSATIIPSISEEIGDQRIARLRREQDAARHTP